MAFVGFRHAHINTLYNLASKSDAIDIVAACEEDAATREQCAAAGVTITHDRYARMLDDAGADAVACGDYYGIRGERLIAAMEAGRHVIGDKPLCTRMDERDRIASLAREKGLKVGCMFDMADGPNWHTVRRLLREGVIGEVHSINFWGQHPLLYGTRPGWYFEAGKHGGTVNDIASHACDLIPWMTGLAIREVTAARGWNAAHTEHPQFEDGGVVMLKLENGGAVLGDVSYFGPNKGGYTMAPYWRYTIAGSGGVLETSHTVDTVTVWTHTSDQPRIEKATEGRPGGFLEDFLADLAGAPNYNGLHTGRVLESMRVVLTAQEAATSGRFPRPL
jgi:predicted dehydrogenase